jgi:hypothetical protein
LLFQESFEPPPGQFTSNSAAGWAPTSGASCVNGSSCMAVPNDGQPHASETLTSTSFDASGVGAAVLGWHHVIDDSFGNPFDRHRVQVSVDGGQSWIDIYDHPQTIDESADKQVDASVIVGWPDVRARFLLEDGGGAQLGWFVDDVYVLGW